MMGHHADRFPEKQKRVDQKFFLNTAADEPFASKWRRFVTVVHKFEKCLGVIYSHAPCCIYKQLIALTENAALLV